MPNPDPATSMPTEIPWQLASTTQVLGPDTLGPDTTAISLFTYVPQLASLDQDYPNERLIYLKFTVSVAPTPVIDLWGPKPPPTDPLNLFATDILPIWRLLFDVRIAPDPFVQGGIRPYFLAAAPLRRAMVETGVVGQQVTEGESKGLAIGKSGAQMHEGYASVVDTSTSSGDYPLPVGGFGSSDSSTLAMGFRDVTQRVDTTQREASTERQELLSHMTNVSNVLTLLNAYGVGSPYLRFALWPRPLRPLAIDPSDPNLWYAQLLQRRSSGIEGIQEFYAIAVVPRTLPGFCVQTQLRRFSVVTDQLPQGKQLELPDGLMTAPRAAILEDYLYNRYPLGTPVDDLDVEPVPFSVVPNYQEIRPVVSNWIVAANTVPPIDFTWVDAWDVDAKAPDLGTGYVGIYKSYLQAWLEMKRDQYEGALLQSPLANGYPIFMELKLDTCFGPPVAPLNVVHHLTVVPAKPKGLPSPVPPPSVPLPSGGRKFDLYRQAVFAWNAMESQLGALVAHARDLPADDLRFDHSKIVDFALRRLADLSPDDPANLGLAQAASWFGLSATQLPALAQQGITSVRDLAEAINVAQFVENSNQRRRAIANRRGAPPQPAQGSPIPTPTPMPPPPPAPLPVVISVQQAKQLRRAFGATLQARYDAVTA